MSPELAGSRGEVHVKRQPKQEKPRRGRADLKRLRRMSDSEVRDGSPTDWPDPMRLVAFP